MYVKMKEIKVKSKTILLLNAIPTKIVVVICRVKLRSVLFAMSRVRINPEVLALLLLLQRKIMKSVSPLPQEKNLTLQLNAQRLVRA